MNLQKKIIIGSAVMIICIVILGTIFLQVLKNKEQCESNPFVYGAIKTAEDGLEIYCSCTPLGGDYVGFTFDKEGLDINSAWPGLNNYLASE